MRLRGATRGGLVGPVLALLPVLVIAVLVLVGRQPQRFAANGIQFEVPATWRIHDQIPPTTGHGQLLAGERPTGQ